MSSSNIGSSGSGGNNSNNNSRNNSLRRRKGGLVRQSIEEFLGALSEIKDRGGGGGGGSNSSGDSNHHDTSSHISPNSTLNNKERLSPRGHNNNNSNTTSSSSSATMIPQKSLAKFYLLAQQIEYVASTHNNILLTPPLPSHPLLPVENFSSILNVQWTTYWTIHLDPTTTCISILNYISQKTNREVQHLKIADSEGRILDHDYYLISDRCKKFVVFEEIELNANNNNSNNSNNSNNTSTTTNNTTTTSSSSPSSPKQSKTGGSRPGSGSGDELTNTTTNNNNNNQQQQQGVFKTPNSPNLNRKMAPAPPPRSPVTYAATNNVLLQHTDLIGEPPSSTNSTPNLMSTSSGSTKSTTTGFSLSSLASSLSSHLGASVSSSIPSSASSSVVGSVYGMSPPTSPAVSRKNSGNNLISSREKDSSRPSSPGNKTSPSSTTTSTTTNQNINTDYGYCKQFLDKVTQFEDDDEYDESTNKGHNNRTPTSEKGKILDNYFNHYYQELFKYIHQRSRRYQKVLDFVKKGGFDEVGGQAWIDKHYESESNYLRNKRAGMKLKDFKILTQIGKGGFGQVFLAIKKDTGDVVTLKRIKKQSYEWANQRTQVSHEKTVMMSEAGGKWITKLLYAFQDSHHLYLAMEYHCGGDFRALLNNLGMFDEKDARFYMAEMVECINSLHSLGYIHRDIKPSNFVIDKYGHIKLIDFGLSKEGYESRNGFNQQSMTDLRKSCMDGTTSWRSTMTARQSTVIAYRRPTAHSAVGSPEYMPPEIVADLGYDLTCDFWSLGCVFMEMLCGFNPFCADTPNDVFINIMQWREVLDWPLFTQDLSEDAADILKRLLCDPSVRFRSIEDFKRHPFFTKSGFKWEEILDQTPPFVPKVENDLDTSYFEDAVNNDPTSWEIDDNKTQSTAPFNNLNIPFFTYRKSSALSAFINDYNANNL